MVNYKCEQRGAGKSILLALALLSQGVCAQPVRQNIAAVLVAEASSEGTNGMKLVAEVIQQRMRDKGWSALKVVLAGRRGNRAFSCLNCRTLEQLRAAARKDRNYGYALRLARLLELSQALGHGARGANHYTRKEERPYWAVGRKPVVIAGHHAFYRLEHY
jgi:spore germination cell wall hydrolase CwlJ-like protein